MQKLPSFFNYKEECTDNGYETIQDFYLSWLLRCAQEAYRNQDNIISEYARRAVYLLINGFNNNNLEYTISNNIQDTFSVLKVATKRQFNNIDLIAEISIQDKGSEADYVLNIENKWYTKITDQQLIKNKNGVSKFSGSNIINLVIFCDDERDINQKNICITNGYKCLSIEDISKLTKMNKTGNALFDEYWFWGK